MKKRLLFEEEQERLMSATTPKKEYHDIRHERSKRDD
jgi:hypothetical protein